MRSFVVRGLRNGRVMVLVLVLFVVVEEEREEEEEVEVEALVLVLGKNLSLIFVESGTCRCWVTAALVTCCLPRCVECNGYG